MMSPRGTCVTGSMIFVGVSVFLWNLRGGGSEAPQDLDAPAGAADQPDDGEYIQDQLQRRRLDVVHPDVAHVDVWRTAYQHPMASAAAIVEWVRATGLKPFVDRLPPELQASYLAEYERRVAKAYPVRTDGKLLLAFPRMADTVKDGVTA